VIYLIKYIGVVAIKKEKNMDQKEIDMLVEIKNEIGDIMQSNDISLNAFLREQKQRLDEMTKGIK
jgi:hypothetical protein